MKKLLQLCCFFSTIIAVACNCDPLSITQKYIQSDFVAKVTIVKIYPNEKNRELYKADIKIHTLYKGKQLKSIYIAGNNGGTGSSCSIFIPENTKLIAYARKRVDGKYTIGMCSGLMYLDYSATYRKKTRKTAKGMKRQRKELAILQLFKEKNIVRTDKKSYFTKPKLAHYLSKFKGIQLSKSAAFFEVTFASNLTVKSVQLIDGFEHPIDEELLEILKESFWTTHHKGENNKVPENSKLLVGIYYYEAEDKFQSFLSHWYV
ncbi:MAG: hypothetical protein AB8B65_14410 [Kordia sp.]|uniref:hypothetical protein n=1 Tax=Kordia sp. TaxID=1965332 RepID=UPI00385FE09A